MGKGWRRSLAVMVALTAIAAGCGGDDDGEAEGPPPCETAEGEATTIQVPEDEDTIQEAVNAAPAGSLVLVSPGTYNEAVDVETGILEAIEATGADLLILGTSVRAGSTRLHLGPRVEFLARNAPCPVVIING